VSFWRISDKCLHSLHLGARDFFDEHRSSPIFSLLFGGFFPFAAIPPKCFLQDSSLPAPLPLIRFSHLGLSAPLGYHRDVRDPTKFDIFLPNWVFPLEVVDENVESSSVALVVPPCYFGHPQPDEVLPLELKVFRKDSPPGSRLPFPYFPALIPFS